MGTHCSLVVALLVLASASGAAVWLGPAAAEDWPQFLRSNEHMPVGTGAIPDAVEKVWEFDFDGITFTSPTVAGGKVYIGAMTGGSDGHDRLYCLDAASGKELWSFDCALQDPSLYGLDSSPCVSGGKVYFGSSDYTAYCLDAATGSKIWSKNLLRGELPSVHYGACASPLVHEGKVYFGTDEGGGPNLFCLDANGNGDGTTDQVWNYSSPDGGVIFSSPAIKDGKLVIGTYVGRTAGEVICLDPSGNGDGTTDQYWHYSIPCSTFASACISNGFAYIGHGDYQNKDLGKYNIYCIPMDSSGELKAIDEKWHYLGDDQFLATPVAHNNKVYVGDMGGLFHCITDQTSLDKTVNAQWTLDTGNQIWATATLVGDRLLVGNFDGDVYCLNTLAASGDDALVWKYNLAASPIYSTCAFVDGKIFVSVKDGKVFCLGEKTAKPPKVASTAPADKAVSVATDTKITIGFDQDMDTASLSGAFAISPKVEGDVTTSKSELRFTPTSPLEPSTKYTVTIKATAESASGDGLDGNGDAAASGSPSDDYKFSFTTAEQGQENSPPTLSQATVDPSTGDEATTFVFWVIYTDGEGDAPDYVAVEIDGTNHLADRQDGGVEQYYDQDLANGERYAFSSELAAGMHTFIFKCSDGESEVSTDMYTLEVSSAPGPVDDDTDDDAEDDDGSKGSGASGNTIYFVLAGMAAFLLIVIVIVVVIKRRRAQ